MSTATVSLATAHADRPAPRHEAAYDLRTGAKATLVGAVAAGLFNVALYYVGLGLGASYRPRDPSMLAGLDAVPPFQPLVGCVVAGAIAFGVYALLHRFVPARAWSAFLVVSAAVFVAEGIGPFWVFSEAATIWALQIMHVPAALGIMWGIHRGRPLVDAAS